jgi:hypothetical protein
MKKYEDVAFLLQVVQPYCGKNPKADNIVDLLLNELQEDLEPAKNELPKAKSAGKRDSTVTPSEEDK